MVRIQFAVVMISKSHGELGPWYLEFDHYPSAEEAEWKIAQKMTGIYGKEDIEGIEFNLLSTPVSNRPFLV